MMRVACILLFYLIGWSVNAQRIQSPLWTDPGNANFVGAYGYGSLVSNHLNNAFIKSLLRDEHLTTESRTQQLDRLTNNGNRIGGDYILAVQAGLNLDTSHTTLLFSMSDEAFVDATFGKDMFDLAFFGNQKYKGDTVSFNQTFARAGRFQKIGVGLSFEPNLGTRYSFMLSFVNGESGLSGQIYNGWLYTSEIGDTVSADVRGRMFYSDTSNTGFLKHNGAGAMLDIHVEQAFDALNSEWLASVLLMNFGGVQWRPSTERYNVDTTISYTGLAITDVNDIQSQVNATSLEDSLLGGIRSGYSRGPINQIFPGWIQMEVKHQRTEGFTFGFGVTARFQSIAAAYGHVVPGYRFNEHFGVDLELGYGGFGRFQSGLAGVYQSDRFRAQVRVANLEAVAVPNAFGGITAAGGIQYFFGL